MRKVFGFILLSSIILSSCSTSRKSATKIDGKNPAGLALDKPNEAQLRKSLIFRVNPSKLKNDNLFKSVSKNSDLNRKIISDLERLYFYRNNQPLWITGLGFKTTYAQLNEQLESASNHGLDKGHYNFSVLNDKVENLGAASYSAEQLAQLDLALSANYLLFNYHIVNGRFNPNTPDHLWYKEKKRIDFIKKLAKVSNARKLNKYFKNILPSSLAYEQMLGHLAFYKKIQDDGGWQEINYSNVKVIEPGTTSNLITDVRNRLLFTDPMNKSLSTASNYYDDELVSAVKKFQRRHGLEVDGRIGQDTFEAMNISVADKVAMISVNLERYRWLPREFSKEHFVINIPEYKLKVYKKNKEKLNMKVIVGKEYTSTPVFADTLEYLVFSPTWTVPKSIKTEEMLPRLQRDSTYYSDRNYKFYEGWSNKDDDEVEPSSIDWSKYDEESFPFNVVQQPGPTNALGLVKFIMPNDLSIYLHDTPTDYLFNKNELALSHGCIRVSKPIILAKYLLKDQWGWNEKKILESMHQEEPLRVLFKKQYHVEVTYFTSFVDEYGMINFRKDIYGHDQAQLNKIKYLAAY